LDTLHSHKKLTRADGYFHVPRPGTPLVFTGERMTSAVEGQIEFEHYHRYCLARDLCVGRDVLDVASGEGYGSALLAGVAASVTGVEIDDAAVSHAAANYAKPNLRFLQGNACALPMPDESVDVVVSFETLEHVADQAQFLEEVRRVLRLGGLFVVSTPDRAVYSAPGSDPNPHHVLELTDPEFRALLQASFSHVDIVAQRPVLGSLLAARHTREWRSYERRSEDIIEATNGLARAHYLVALASDAPLPEIPSSVYLDRRRVHDVMQGLLRLSQAEAELARARESATPLAQARLRAAETRVIELVREREAAEVAAVRAAEASDAAGRRAAEAVAAAEDAAEQARRARDAVIYSTSWRLLSPLRAFGTRYPSAAHALRRSTKLVFWTLTLQIGHRYAGWRRERARLASSSVADPSADAEAPAAKSRPSESEPSRPRAHLPIRNLRASFNDWHGRAPIYFPPVEAPDVTVVIPVHRGQADLENCLRSLAVHRATEPPFEVILVDDCPDESVLWSIPDSGGLIKLANAQNLGFLQTCNRGAAAARGRFICFLNSDTIVSAGWLSALVAALQEVRGAAIAGGMLLNIDGTIQSAGWRILRNGWGYSVGAGADPNDGAYTYRHPVDCVTGACILVSREVFAQLDGFDPSYSPAFYEEFDLAFRARAQGLKAVYAPDSRVVHLGSASYGADRRDELSSINQAKFVQRFADVLRRQPADAEDEFLLRHPPADGPVLLVVEKEIPQPDRHAGDVTMSRYLSILVTAGWQVVYGAMEGPTSGPHAEAIERQGIELIRSPATIEGWLKQNGRHVHEVWLARPEIAAQMIGLVRANTTARIAYYTHDLHHVRLAREADILHDAALRAQAALVAETECTIFRSVDCVMSPSRDEAAIIRGLAPVTPVAVLPPYYYEEDEIRARDADHFAGLSDVVFVGGFPHTPNVDAAIFIANEIMPLVWRRFPDTRLVLVGYAPPPAVAALASARVTVTGQVPKVEPFLERARVVLAALRYGAGVKGKTVDALRQGVPVVATSIGAEGIGIEPGRHAIVADDARSLAAGVVELLRDPHRCAGLSTAGAELVRERFSRAAARAAIGEVFRTPRCAICGSADLMVPPADDFGDATVCGGCLATGRTEALGRVLLERLARHGDGSLAEAARHHPHLRVHQLGSAGAVSDTLRGEPWFTVSEVVENLPLEAREPDKSRLPSLSRLSFADASFDLLISQDIMDPLADPFYGFTETARLLRPGGSHIFVPQRYDSAARLDSDERSAAALAALGLRLIVHDLPVIGGTARDAIRIWEAVKPALGRPLPQPHAVSAAVDRPAVGAAAALALADLQDRTGAFESLIQACYSAELRPGASSVDGGANHGLHTAPMARCVGPDGRVHAFEPLPFAAAALRRTFATTPQVTVHEKALTEQPGIRTFNYIVNNPELSSLLKRDLGSTYPDLQTRELQVETTTLDQLADEPVRFIKLDLEGYDYHALQGGRVLLMRQRPVVALEFGRRDAAIPAGYGPDEFFGLFAAIGFDVFDLFGRRFGRAEFDLPWNAREMPHYVVAVPAERTDVAPRLRDQACALVRADASGVLVPSIAV
jgi:FkbM family methyltransferase